MSTFGKDLIQSLEEALAHAKGEGPANVHAVASPREVRKEINLTPAQMAPLMGMCVSGYRVQWCLRTGFTGHRSPGQRQGVNC